MPLSLSLPSLSLPQPFASAWLRRRTVPRHGIARASMTVSAERMLDVSARYFAEPAESLVQGGAFARQRARAGKTD
ncbi:hypothetical protein ANT2_2954 [plant metagenome]|uniref:Uncharacterized protein n=1 Tax=plant metagenome TaxID=1297885 RepID=A0A484SPE8_9ZZZZ